MKADPITPCFQKVFTKSLWLKSKSAVQDHMHRHLTGTAFPMPSNPSRGVSTCSERARSLQSSNLLPHTPPSVHPSPISYCWRQGNTPLFTVTCIASWFPPVSYHQVYSRQLPQDQPPFSDQERAWGSSKTCLSYLKTLLSTGFCFYLLFTLL